MMKKLFLALSVCTMVASAQDEIPDLPIASNVLQYLHGEGVIEVTSYGFYVENGTQTNGTQTQALAKVSGCCSVLRFLKRNIVDPVSGTTNFVLDGANVVVSQTTDGIKWTVDKTTDGVSYVVEKTFDGTRWTINSAIDGTQVIIRQSTSGLSWSVEKVIPGEIRIGGRTYVDFDPVKNIIHAGIRVPAKAANQSLEVAQAGLNYWNTLTKDLAVGTLDLVDGVTYVSMDIVTFASSSTINIAEKLTSLDFAGAIIQSQLTFYYAFSNVMGWGELGWCGSMLPRLDMVATRRMLISDYWPPDEHVTNLLAIGAQQCRIFGLARLYKGCSIHDFCYGVPGKTKEECDGEIRSDWMKACSDTYRSSSWCKMNCEANVDVFHKFLAGGPPQPFTEAQSKSNSDPAFRDEQINKYNYYKSKYRDGSSNEYSFAKPVPTGFQSQPYIVPFISKGRPPTIIPVINLLSN